MKLFKSSILAIFALVLGATVTSCSDDNNIIDAPETGLYILSQGSTVNIPADGSDIVLTVCRHSADDPNSVAVTLTDNDGIFTGPATVEFEGNSLTTSYIISYDNAAIEEDVKYNVEVKLDPTQASHYGVANYNVTFIRLSPWTSKGKALYRDDLFASVYNIDNLEYEVEILESDKNPGLYRLVNAYGKAFAYNEDGDYDDSKDYYIEIDATNPERVSIGMTETGVDWGEGAFVFESRAQYFVENGNDPDAVYNAGWYGTLKDGVITFPTKGFYIGIGEEDYAFPYFYGNTSGLFRVVLPGYVVADYSASVDFSGRFVDPEDNSSAVVNVTLGADVEKAKVACVYDVTDASAIAAAIVADEIEYQEITQSGELKFPLTESGKYCIVAVTFAGNEAKEVASTVIEISLGGGDDWKTAGEALILDGWLLGGTSQYDPMDFIWSTEYQTSASNPGLIKIVDMYGETSPMASMTEGKHDIIFDITNPEFVVLEPQYTGCGLFSEGIAYISNGYMFTLIGGYTVDEVIEAGLNSTYEIDPEDNSGMISVPAGACFLNFGDDSWYRTKQMGAILLQPSDATPAVKKFTVSHKNCNSKQTISAALRVSHPALAGAHRAVAGQKVKSTTFSKAK